MSPKEHISHGFYQNPWCLESPLHWALDPECKYLGLYITRNLITPKFILATIFSYLSFSLYLYIYIHSIYIYTQYIYIHTYNLCIYYIYICIYCISAYLPRRP